MDPGTFTKKHMQSLQQVGFNRISLGVQLFNNTILEGIGRVYRHDDMEQAIGIMHDVVGPDANYSLDLISGLPGLTLDLWSETLRMALALDPAPNHLSVYDLQIAQGTHFGKWLLKCQRYYYLLGPYPRFGCVNFDVTLSIPRIISWRPRP